MITIHKDYKGFSMGVFILALTVNFDMTNHLFFSFLLKGSSSKKHGSGDGSEKSSHAEKSQFDTEASPHYVFPWNAGIKRKQTAGYVLL